MSVLRSILVSARWPGLSGENARNQAGQNEKFCRGRLLHLTDFDLRKKISEITSLGKWHRERQVRSKAGTRSTPASFPGKAGA